MEKILSRAEILYQNQRAVTSVSREIPLDVNGLVTGESIVDASLTDTIQPINPVTGWRDNSISRLMSPNTPNVERELIYLLLLNKKVIILQKSCQMMICLIFFRLAIQMTL